MATHALEVEHTTALALQEKGKLIKSLSSSGGGGTTTTGGGWA